VPGGHGTHLHAAHNDTDRPPPLGLLPHVPDHSPDTCHSHGTQAIPQSLQSPPHPPAELQTCRPTEKRCALARRVLAPSKLASPSRLTPCRHARQTIGMRRQPSIAPARISFTAASAGTLISRGTSNGQLLTRRASPATRRTGRAGASAEPKPSTRPASHDARLPREAGQSGVYCDRMPALPYRPTLGRPPWASQRPQPYRPQPGQMTRMFIISRRNAVSMHGAPTRWRPARTTASSKPTPSLILPAPSARQRLEIYRARRR